MKITLSTSQIADRLRADEYAGWSYAGAMALAEYLEELEESIGEELELDVVAIRCDYSEYPDAIEAADDFGYETKDEQDAIEFLDSNTSTIQFDGGIIVQSF